MKKSFISTGNGFAKTREACAKTAVTADATSAILIKILSSDFPNTLLADAIQGDLYMMI